MVYINGSDRAASSISEDNSATIIDRDNADMHLNRDGNGNDLRKETTAEMENHPIIEINDNFPLETAMETSSNEEFDKPVQEEETRQIIKTNDNFPQEVAIETYSHEEFNKFVQEEENHPIIEINDNFPQETAIETSSHEDFDKVVQEEENQQIIENSDNFPQDVAIETYSHEEFDKFVQEEKNHPIIEIKDNFPQETVIETSSHEKSDTHQIIESNDNFSQETETAIETFSHEDFEKLVHEEETRQIYENDSNIPRHEDSDKLLQEKEKPENDINARVESAFESYSHQDFDNLIQEEEASENNIHVRVESTFESYTHQDFDNLIQADSHPIGETKNANNNKNDSYDKVDTTLREEVTAHHTKTGFRNPTDTRGQDRLPEVHKDPIPIAAATSTTPPRSSDLVAGVSVVATKGPVTVVTAPPIPPDLDAGAENILQNPHPNNQITITYLTSLTVVAVIAFSLAKWVVRRRRSNRQKMEVYQYLGAFDVEDIDMRRAITGGWHGQYRNNLAKGLDTDSDFETYSDSDDGSRTSGSGADETTIVFLERGDLSSPIQSKKRSLPFTMLVADRNIYLDESTNGADSDDDDIFSPVRTRPF